MRTGVQSLASLSGLRIWCGCELWCRSQTKLRSYMAVAEAQGGAAAALIRPLAWELPYAKFRYGPKKKKKRKMFFKKSALAHILPCARHGLKCIMWGVPIVAQWLTNLTRNHEVAGSIPGLAHWVKDPALP